MSVYRTLALSVHPLAKTARRYYRAVLNLNYAHEQRPECMLHSAEVSRG